MDGSDICCSCCNKQWNDRDAFVKDDGNELVGYQVHFEDLQLGFFLFNCGCGTTLALKAGMFFDLYKGPVFKERKTGGDDCPGHCLHEHELDTCPSKCECAFVREIIQTIKNT